MVEGTKEEIGKFKKFNRILISYNDFNHAYDISSILIDNEFYSNYPKKNRLLVIAMNCAAIIAYSRPFTNNKGQLANNKISDKLVLHLTSEEKKMHDIILNDRNTILAHSDPDELTTIPLVRNVNNKKVICPGNSSPFTAILSEENMRELKDLSLKHRETCYELRMEMETEMKEILPMVGPDGDIF